MVKHQLTVAGHPMGQRQNSPHKCSCDPSASVQSIEQQLYERDTEGYSLAAAVCRQKAGSEGT